MDKKIGHRIKYHRLKSRMTQTELSNGVISVSYLSKIENGEVEPRQEVVSLLSKKLNMELEADEHNGIEFFKAWFRHLLVGNRKEAVKGYQHMKGHMNIADTSYRNIIDIHRLSYYILINDKANKEKQYKYLHSISHSFTEAETYYWYKFMGDYHFSLLSFKKALSFYQRAEDYLRYPIYSLKDEENDLYYLIALSASKLRQTHHTFSYATKALDYYQKVYNLKRCAECHILLGISYRRTYELDKAKESYQLAATIAELANEHSLYALCNQNLGKVYSLLNKSEEAIGYYLKSYELHASESISDQIVPVSSLMKEFYQKRDYTNADKWLQKGLDLSESLTPLDSIYVYEFKVYWYLIHGIEDREFVSLITKKVLPFLDEIQLPYEKYKYLKILADYYFDNRKYKLAASYYNYANSVLSGVYKERW
ncbi:helix-turn-helix transcriptional regulator [Oceanobacillus sp. FSL K6-2867]|uniref:helix-turn-helix domain-containing protein n=1 Tax=Oceanobacillus sp. FSL K6-2867 TaxID=2954748 RepID=UPI0030DB958E